MLRPRAEPGPLPRVSPASVRAEAAPGPLRKVLMMVLPHVRHGLILASLLLAGACGPLGADDPQQAALTGIWRIDRIGDGPPPQGRGPNEVEIGDGRLLGQLACSYVEAEMPGGTLDRQSLRVDGTKCPAWEVDRAQELKAVLADPAAEWALEGDRLQIGGPDGTLWRRLPGSEGPKGELEGITGFWLIRTIDGKPPQPGLDNRQGVGVMLDAFRVSAYSGCNNGGTRIFWEEDGYSAEGPFLATEMLCAPLRTQEERIFAILTDSPRITRLGDSLRVTGQSGGELVLVRP